MKYYSEYRKVFLCLIQIHYCTRACQSLFAFIQLYIMSMCKNIVPIRIIFVCMVRCIQIILIYVKIKNIMQSYKAFTYYIVCEKLLKYLICCCCFLLGLCIQLNQMNGKLFGNMINLKLEYLVLNRLGGDSITFRLISLLLKILF